LHVLNVLFGLVTTRLNKRYYYTILYIVHYVVCIVNVCLSESL